MTHEHLKALGVSKTNNEAMYADAQSVNDPFSLLECFPAPSNRITSVAKGSQTVRINCPEFTSLCPITGQPDFANIIIEYVPNESCVESKSLKLYLLSFRNRGHFHEAIVDEICNALATLLRPRYLRVKGEFTPRGGISIHPESTYYGIADETQPQPESAPVTVSFDYSADDLPF